MYVKPVLLSDYYERVRPYSSVYFCHELDGEGIEAVHAADVWTDSLPLMKAVVLDSAPREGKMGDCELFGGERIIFSIKVVGELTPEEFVALQSGSSTNSSGTTHYYKAGKLHRDGDLPAVINTREGLEEFWRDGEKHRDGDLPAVVSTTGVWLENRLERGGDQPASVVTRGDRVSKQWYVNGNLHREGDQPAYTVEWAGKVCFQQWYRHGQKHRYHQPAYVREYGRDERPDCAMELQWYVDDVLHRKAGLPARVSCASMPKRCEWYWRGTLLCRFRDDFEDGGTVITWHMPAGYWPYVSDFKIAEWSLTTGTRRFHPPNYVPFSPFRELAALLPLRLHDGTLLPNQEFGYEITAHARWDQRVAGASLLAANKLPENVIMFL